MIKINLLGSKVEQNPSLVFFIASWLGTLFVFFAACLFWKISLVSSISNLEEKNKNLKIEQEKLDEKTKKVNDIEQIKKDLNEKLKVIDILKKNKLGPVKLLDELNIIIPSKVWLESIEEVNKNIKIVGKSLDDQSLSSFMKMLEKSKYFKNVDLNYSKQFYLEDVKIKDFEIKAKVSYSDKEEETFEDNAKEALVKK